MRGLLPFLLIWSVAIAASIPSVPNESPSAEAEVMPSIQA
jgi:hypothetical protein